MIFSTFYFSGTGNTRWAVKQFNNIISQSGHEGFMYTIEDENLSNKAIKEILIKSDYLGFALPIYGANVPPIMKEFIQKVNEIIKNIENIEENFRLPVYFINTFGYKNAFGPFAAKKLLHKKLELISYQNIKLCNNISTPPFKLNPVGKEILDRRKEKAIKELSIMVTKLLEKKKHITGVGPHLIAGILVRKILKRPIRNQYKSLSFNPDKCTQCLMCVENCPTGSITFAEDGFKVSSSCTSCMRCYNFCPNHAVEVGGKYADPDLYKRYRGPDKV